MGKRTKKIKKNIMGIQSGNKGASANTQRIMAVKEKVAGLKANEQYEDALQEIIALFETGYADAVILYETADIYYLAGDYERAITWANKTLEFDGRCEDAVLLLAKLYAFQDELRLCFGTLEKLLYGKNLISEEIKTEIADLLDYFTSDYTEEDLRTGYPSLWNFSQTLVDGAGEDGLPCDEEEEGVLDQAEDMVEDCAFSKEEESSATAPLDCLKGKAAEDIIVAIMAQPNSLLEKVDACLYFAVYYYGQKDVARTLMMLKQAMLIDAHNDLVLKNIGFVLAEMGEKQGALDFLLKIKEKDLMVLHQIALLG